jgi:hypothetical protein
MGTLMSESRSVFVLIKSEEESSLGRWNPSVDLASVTCSLYPEHQRAGSRLTPLSVDLPKSMVERDFAWTWYSECLIRPSLGEKLKNSGLTGFYTRKAHVTHKGVAFPNGFDELFAVGWGGIADPRSGVRLIESCPACGMLSYSGVTNWNQLVDWNQWDGSDIFMVWPLPRFIFMTERGAQILTASRLTGAQIIAVTELDPQEDLSPGRLSYWLPAEIISKLKISPEFVCA